MLSRRALFCLESKVVAATRRDKQEKQEGKWKAEQGGLPASR